MGNKLKKRLGDKGKRIAPTIDTYPQFKHPVFCFRFIEKRKGIMCCEKDEKVALLHTLRKLSTKTWVEIHIAPKHGIGAEKIPHNELKVAVPSHIAKDTNFYALRFQGKKVFVGYKTDFIFHIVWIDRDFSLYNH